MRKIAAFTLTLLFAISVLSQFALAGGQEDTKEKPLWIIISDSFKDFKVSEQDKMRPVAKVSIFQSMSDGIKEGSAKAKDLSLRDK